MASPGNDVVEALRVTLKERDRLRLENQRLLASATEPIAILGMSCRYPGEARSPEELWRLVAAGVDAVTTFPADRGWDLERLYDPEPGVPGTSYSREGGFVEDAAEFDPGFFGIGPREAVAMDPQQRLLLEVSWQALEDAGIDPTSLRGGAAGVFTGVMYHDYGWGIGSASPARGGDGPTVGTGAAASGRVAYALGLEGPTMSVDTACSSSLVAMHLAAQALRQGECTLALAGGATVLSTPRGFLEFSRQRGLARDGRCKSFAEAADGVGLSEGAGMLVLERLSDAERNGHPILAVIRGSAVNQDGASNGITAPNGPSQERVIRQALANAGLEPGDVDAVEAHGTGTTLGDPIEAGALLATYGQDRETPLKLGSIKSNIGHTQAAAGVAGVIKTVLAMREEMLPQTLHVDAPSSKVNWEAGRIELLTEQVSWEVDGRPRRAGVSSFGASGTNAHVVLEEAPAPVGEDGNGAPDDRDGDAPAEAEQSHPPPGPTPLVLSAKTEPALREAAARLSSHFRQNPELDPTDVALSLLTTRASFEQRAVALGEGREELLDALAVLAEGGSSPNALTAKARGGKLAYLFTGQGAQRLDMGRELYETHPAFRGAFDLVCEHLDPLLETPLKEIVFAKGKKAEKALEDTTYAQPALFAIEVALFRALESQGLAPNLLAGHSVGEISAAHVSGVLSLPDACKLIAARGKLMGELPAGGAMVAIEATEAEAEEYLEGREAELAIAAINGPRATVLSGTEEAIESAQAHWTERERKTKRLAVSHAFHSPLIEPMLDPFSAIAQGLQYQEPQIPIVSNVTGEILSPEQATDPAYWVSHVRAAVRFADSVATLASEGASAYLELGPDPVLIAMAEGCLEDDEEPALIPTLREGRPEGLSLTAALAGAHAAGARVEWEAFFEGVGAKQVKLPTYPFQRERFWLNAASGSGDPSAIGQADPDHPLLGAAIEDPQGEGLTLTGRLCTQTHPWLADHAVAGTVLLPGTAFVELALRAGEEVEAPTLQELTLQAPLVFAEGRAVQIQVSLGGPDEEGNREVEIHSRPEGSEEAGEWVTHASGVLSEEALETQEPLTAWPPEGAEPLETEGLYDRLADAGFEYGPAFQGLTAAWQMGDEVYAEVSLAPEQKDEAARFGLHPALLDAALHAIGLISGEDQGLALPFSWSAVSFDASGATELRVHLRREGEEISLTLADPSGAPLAQVGSLLTRPVDPSQLRGAGQSRAGGLLGVQWQQVTLASEESDTNTSLWRCEPDPGADAAASARSTAQGALAGVKEWLAAEHPPESRLALITKNAVAAREGESPDLAAATVWGLVRSAQSEHPGRFLLIDTDASESSEASLPAALASEEPQLALREGEGLAPRVTRLPAPSRDEGDELPQPLDPDKTILITGATGGLGALVARHLAEHHGARHLLLASRSGPEAEGAEELQAELEELGAETTIVVCDVSDRDALEALLDSIPAEHPLGAVIHAAGVLADGLIESLTEEKVERVFAPKAEAAWHLHELTAGLDLSAFVLFSSGAGVLGGPGQANYAAANSFLDALAERRRADGLSATSIAWGLWQRESGMTSQLGGADLARLERSGVGALSDEQGLALFDEALVAERAAPLAVRLDPAGLRSQAAAGVLPAILGGLVRTPSRRRSAASGSLGVKLAALPEAEHEGFALALVRAEVAAVLGHGSAEAIEPERAFKDLGFDSLAAVELRNRLDAATGLRLPATVVFDYPSCADLGSYLLAEATAGGLRGQIAVRAQAVDEPIAIVGMSCRYPGGASSPEQLWQLVASGSDGVSAFPEDRGWDLAQLYHPDPERRGTSYAREGGFLGEAGEFDAEFFGIAPREALAMDPQQRLLLETCWEALEAAGIDPASLRGEPAGVFAGVMYQDYGNVDQGLGPGMGSGVASGRVAYTFGLEGPAITVDTACSSSLVAMHLAAQALRQGECTLALAGGATVLGTPGVFTEFSRQRGLAPDGRSKSFAEAADGVGFAEGVGVLVLERLSEAERNGHPVLATFKGSAVNQDGASNGLTAPNGPSQERVIRQALANAGLKPRDVDAVEAHGTGTTLGDPIEAGALLATYGQDRETPLKLGSIKSNIGHTQAAAGVAGVIKTVMAMRAGVLPKTLHLDAPSSKVDWESGEIELLTEQVRWERDGRPRRVGVSSFGASGTNAHLIVEEAPEPTPAKQSEGDGGTSAAASEGAGEEAPGAPQAERPLPTPLPLSAKTEPALRDAASRLATHLRANPDLDPTDVAYSLTTTRSVFEQRAVALGKDREELLGSLSALAEGKENPRVVKAKARSERSPAFLFPGQGAQHAQMALGLLESSPTFASHIEECEAALSPYVDWSLTEVLREEQGRWLDRLDVVQPALFAVMVSFSRLWQKSGVSPAVVVGHSQGEIAAAHIAGGLSLDDAARIVSLRAKAMAKIAGKGGMLSVSLPVKEMEPRLEPFAERLSLAAINGPASLVISGEPEALEELQDSCEAEGIRAQKIAVDYAAHSSQIEELKEELLEAFEPISPRSGEIPFHSTLTGELTDTKELNAEYWYRNLRETVRLEPVLRSLLAQGQRNLIEIGPHPVLGFSVEETIEDTLEESESATVLSTLRREEGTPERFGLSLAEAHANGMNVEWDAFFEGTRAKAVPLPTYPFQRKRYWLTSSSAGDLSAAGQSSADHPLLGAALSLAGGECLLTGRLCTQTHPWLADHAVAGTVLLPGTAFVELALRAGEEVEAPTLQELTLQAPLLFAEGRAVQIQVSVGGPDEEGNREVEIHSRPEGSEEAGEWVTHASGVLSEEALETQEPLTAWPPEGAEPLETEGLYDRLADAGFEYGPAFQGLTAAWQMGDEVYAEVSLAPEQKDEAARFGLHPALLDAALHAIGLISGEDQGLALPFSWSGVSIDASGATELRVHLRREGEEISLTLADPSGAPLAQVGSLLTRPVDPSQLRGAGQSRAGGLLGVQWQQVSLSSEESDTNTSLWRCEPDPKATDAAAAARSTAQGALAAVKEWLAAEHPPESRLALITHNAVAAREGESPDLAAATVWGLVRSAQSEHPGRFLLIDTDASESSEASLPAALASEEPQLALREGEGLAPRAISAKDQGDLLLPPPGPWRLDAEKRGTLESLALVSHPAASEPLRPSEVRIAMRAAGLNFRDVLVALGFVVPGAGRIGGEGAGVVIETGSGVTDLAPGDRVMGLIGEAFGPLAIGDRRVLTPMPERWSFEQAASVPIVFLTTYHGLVGLADLQPGEKVLIHAGAGGVGMAAVQLAHHLGAEVFATASPAKWDLLREAGIAEDHIATSRDLKFKDEFLEATAGEGVDVVLNSLAGDFVDASLGLLPRGGRFLEIGQTDIRDPERVAAEHEGVAYRCFDIIDLEPEQLGGMLPEIVELFERGAVRHHPISAWDVRRAPQAFRHLREGLNVGKTVLTLPQPLDPDKTVLITGATGGLGALVARHLAEHHGARHLLLASRSGPKAQGAEDLQAELEGLGAEARIAACDVSDRGQVAALIDSIPAEHPLGAVLHAAGVLADGLVETMSPEQLQSAFAPKAEAAWHLHELSAGMELSAFVMFSSLSATLGGPGQANYAAANSFLDALAERRRAEGLPATSIAWGLWERESGMTSHLGEADRARLGRSGLGALSDEQGLALFDEALELGLPLALAPRLELSVLRSLAQAGALPPLLSGLVRVPARRAAASGSLATKLATLPEAEREAFVLELVRTEVAAVLGHGSAAEVDPEKAFQEMGFDSLAAVELRNRLGVATGLRLPATTVFDYPAPVKLAGYLAAEATASGSSRRVAVRAQASEEPIAILGMSCRYPGGANSPEQLWQLLAAGRDGITTFPADRGWDLERLYHPDPDNSGTSYTREGGFLADAPDFDAEFFGISPREALAMDPQQRLLLEAAWEAFEDAGLDPAALRGSQTGVFAGTSSQDYTVSLRASGQALEGLRLTGGTSSVVSGRVAYALGLEGPAMSVDTACSSSLVAMHLAAGALRGGECSIALAGGVTVLATPDVFTEFSRQRGLAPDGRSKSFAEAADGVAWSEGVGVLVLERLSDAERNGHQVLALLRGGAVNQDGASNGLTAPNGPAQERVILQALANAGLEPGDVDAVEAHGTGTMLGDPIEAGALLATYGQDRETPLRLGSIKSNIGHAQAAAGVAGVIKMVQAMREGVLPQTLHVDAPSSNVDWEAGEIELLTEQIRWERDGRPRRAGISSFGVSGTNAHLIVEEAPEPSPVEPSEEGEGAVEAEQPQPLPGPTPLVLSAKTEPALREAAVRLASHLRQNPDLDPTDVAWSLTSTRSVFEQRAVALGEGREELLDALAVLAEGGSSPNAITAKARGGKLAYLFTGQGAQRLDMGRELYEAHPAFRGAFEQICELLGKELGVSLKEIVFAKGKKAEKALEDTTYAQPALFAIEVALFRALESQGLTPDLLAGHSVGEISAAHVSGVLSLSHACKLIAARGKLMGELPGGGAMVAIEATEAEAQEYLEGREAELAIAAINGPMATVLSGAEEAIETAQAHWTERERKTKRLSVSHAFHSPLIEPMLEGFAKVAKELNYQEPQIPIVSNVTGEILGAAEATDPEYWVSHARSAVRFADSVATLQRQGASAYLELGPDPVLIAMAEGCLEGDEEPALIPTLREGRPEGLSLTAALAGAHATGARVEWGAFFEGTGAKQVKLPTYPFQRKRYWLSLSAAAGDASAIGQADPDHPLLGAAIEDPQGEGLTLTGRLSTETHPWLADHAVAGTVLLPGTAFVELALRAGEEVEAQTLQELTLQAPLVFAEGGAVQIQLSVGAPDEEGGREISIHSRAEGDEGEGEWTTHASGILSTAPSEARVPLGAWPPEGAEPLAVDDFYDRLADIGFEYGPAFQGLTAAWRDGEEVYAEVSLAPGQKEEAGRFGVHPALLDAALHAIGLLSEEDRGLALPFSWSGVSIDAGGATELRVHLQRQGEGVSLALADPSGAPVAQVDSLLIRPVDPSRLQRQSREGGLLGIEWKQVQLERAPSDDGGADTSLWRWEPEGEATATTTAAAGQALAAVQEWLAAEHPPESRLALITHNAVAAGEGESPDLAAATVWGLVRSAQSEHPGRFVLIDSDGREASEAALPLALASEEPQLALREGEGLAPRVTHLPAPSRDEGDELPQPLDPDKTVLITGATGGLGALVARHLAEHHGARHLLLASRSGPKAQGAEDLQAELEGLGAEARIAACDVSDRGQVAALIDSIPAEHPLGAVLHAAGVLADGLVETMSPEQLQSAFAPKAEAAWHLHELSAGMELSAFVMFSSLSATLGGPGQANYAAANSFLDALAERRRAEGLPATSIAWGLWERESGMTSHLGEADRARLGRSGLGALSDEQGLALFDEALELGLPLALAPRLELSVLRSLAQAGALPPLLSGLVRVPARRAAASGSLATKLATLPEAEREAFVLELVRTEVAAVLGHGSAAEVDPEKAFQEMGFDSLAAVELRNRLGVATGLRLPATTVFDYPAPVKLAGYLGEAVGASGGVSADAELDRLKLAISEIASEDPERAKLAAQLRALATDLESDGASGNGRSDPNRLESASDDELLDFIDEQVGSA